jgi:hypothetical protein
VRAGGRWRGARLGFSLAPRRPGRSPLGELRRWRAQASHDATMNVLH